MEALVIALLAIRNQYRQPERSVVEPDDFRPFDLQALKDPKHSYQPKGTSPSRPFGRQQSRPAEAVS
jgi:hypothetical protein